MRGEELVLLAWNDLVGLTRGRGVPVAELDDRMERGIGWAMAGQALTPFAAIADNPWGPIGEVQMTPDPQTQVRVDLWPDQPPLNFVLCDALNPDGTPWEACTRSFLAAALRDLERETGLRLLSSFELEFDLAGTALPPGPPFTLEAFRVAPAFGALVVQALREAGAEPETFEPEYGVGQYEVSCRPAFGIAGADRAVAIREVVREVARRMGYRASFTPIVAPDRPGNGAHIHFSLHRDGLPALFDPARPGGLSEVAGRFAAGIVRHLPALCAFTAPSVVSYLRLGPHHWSSGYACCAVGNREAALRICPGTAGIPLQAARQFNLEYRPADSAASPYLALGAIVRAGLEGIREELPPPPLLDRDPDELGEEDRQRLGVRRLPRTLGEALDTLAADAAMRSWFPAGLWEVYSAVKRMEIQILNGSTPEDVCERYRNAY